MSGMFRSFSRLIAIFWVAARYDLLVLLDLPGLTLLGRILRRGDLATTSPGQRLAQALVALGPTFIKLGQALSTRADLVGEEMAAELSELQDRLAPFATAKAIAIIEHELGHPLEAIYSSFDPIPVAAASIAQVHFAITTDGQEVAVKILRPGVERAFARDVEMLAWLAQSVEWIKPGFRRLRPVDTVETLAATVELEMDLRFEAAAAAELAENFVGDESFLVPKVDWTRTSRRVMTLERVSGISVDERDLLIAAGHDIQEILKKAAEAFFNMVFRDGFFHGDLHPGNLFVDKSGNLVAVDFGIMGRVDEKTRHFLAEMLLGFLNGDYRKVAEIHFAAGYVPAHKSVDAFTQAARSIAEPILGRPLHEISVARLLGQLFEVTETFAMETQPQLLLLQKSMLVAEGLGRRLDPTINMWELARPLIEGWMGSQLGVRARISQSVRGWAQSLERLPRLIDFAEHAALSMQSGGLKLHPDTVKAMTGRDGSSGPGFIRTWLPWVLVVALVAALALR